MRAHRSLFLGTTLDQNTMFHTFEAFAQVPYLMRGGGETFMITGADGKTRPMEFRRHALGPDRRFAETTALLESKSILRRGNVAGSESLLVAVAPMAALMREVLASDPRYLLA